MEVEVKQPEGFYLKAIVTDVLEDSLNVSYEQAYRKPENVEFSKCRAVVIENVPKRQFKSGDLVDAFVRIDKNDADELRAYMKMKIRDIKADFAVLQSADTDGTQVSDIIPLDQCRHPALASQITADSVKSYAVDVSDELCSYFTHGVDTFKMLQEHVPKIHLKFDPDAKQIVVKSFSIKPLKQVQILQDTFMLHSKQKMQLLNRHHQETMKLLAATEPPDEFVEEFKVQTGMMGLAIGSQGTNIGNARKLDGVKDIVVDESQRTQGFCKIKTEDGDGVVEQHRIVQCCFCDLIVRPERFGGRDSAFCSAECISRRVDLVRKCVKDSERILLIDLKGNIMNSSTNPTIETLEMYINQNPSYNPLIDDARLEAATQREVDPAQQKKIDLMRMDVRKAIETSLQKRFIRDKVSVERLVTLNEEQMQVAVPVALLAAADSTSSCFQNANVISAASTSAFVRPVNVNKKPAVHGKSAVDKSGDPPSRHLRTGASDFDAPSSSRDPAIVSVMIDTNMPAGGLGLNAVQVGDPVMEENVNAVVEQQHRPDIDDNAAFGFGAGGAVDDDDFGGDGGDTFNNDANVGKENVVIQRQAFPPGRASPTPAFSICGFGGGDDNRDTGRQFQQAHQHRASPPPQFPSNANLVAEPTTSVGSDEQQLQHRHLSPALGDEADSDPWKTMSLVVWRGLFVWNRKTFFNCTCTAVSGGRAVFKAGREMVGDGGGGDAGRIHLIGRPESRAVWEEGMRQLRDSMARQVCLMIINRPEDGHDLATYMNCFERYNQGRQVGVLDFADHPTIEDGYVFTLSAGVALPAALLPLDGAGLPEWAKHNESIVLVLICRMDHEDYKAHSERLLQAHSRGHCAIWEQQQLLKHGGGGLPPCGGRHLYPYRDRQRSKPDHQRLNTGGETGDDDKSETDHNHHNSNHNNRSAANSPSSDHQQQEQQQEHEDDALEPKPIPPIPHQQSSGKPAAGGGGGGGRNGNQQQKGQQPYNHQKQRSGGGAGGGGGGANRRTQAAPQRNRRDKADDE